MTAAGPAPDAAQRLDWTDRAAVADHLARVAVQLAARVRVDPAHEVHAWVQQQVPAGEWIALACVLAAHVPTEATSRQLLAWVGPPAWTYLAEHNEYERLRKAGAPRSEMPAGVVRGEQLYQSAVRRARREVAA